MDLQAFSLLFNRALSLTFVKKKLLGVFCVLALSGLLVVFFRGISLHASGWMQLSLTFLPVFLCIGILLSTGIFLIRVYYHEVKQQEISYTGILKRSWEMLLGASYFAIPLIICYVLLWMLLGIFVLLGQTPALGDFFSIVLAFAPFLIHLGILILCLISLFLLFYVAPAIAFKGLEKGAVFQTVTKRLEANPFLNILLLLTALLPVGFVLTLLLTATTLTGSVCLDSQTLLQKTLQWFFIMLPFTAILTPAIIFFFNFAAEGYMFMQKYVRHLL
jgi:hypothetical protein